MTKKRKFDGEDSEAEEEPAPMKKPMGSLFEAGMSLLDVKDECLNVNVVLMECIEEIRNGRNRKGILLEKLQVCASACKVVHDVLCKKVPQLSKVPSIMYSHKRQKVEKKQKELMSSQVHIGRGKSQEMKRLQGFISNKIETGAQTKPKQKSTRESCKRSNIPEPMNGLKYTKSEIIEILSPMSKEERGKTIRHFLEEDLLHCKKAQVYAILKSAKEGNEVR